jgi:glycosyltransferase involved in cell wall biosynthesis
VATFTPGRRRLAILGTRGIPARHGGFETFAERLALHLTGSGWEVEVYCPDSQGGQPEEWRGVRLRQIPVGLTGALGSVIFDLKATLIAARRERLVLNLGYNTAVFGFLLRATGCTNIINMDGIEWKRQKWSYAVQRWFQANEWIAARLGDHLVADNPNIADHLARHTPRSKMTTIAYGADAVYDADETPVHALGLTPGQYALIIGRPEPENSILPMIRAFSSQARGCTLAVLGRYDGAVSRYQRAVLAAAGPEVRFLGAIYDPKIVQSLRCHATLYLHGHQVGGTNPSLVEALGAGNVIVAFDNRFNRSVAGPTARYFTTENDLRRELEAVLQLSAAERQRLRDASWERHARLFAWDDILGRYERLLAFWHDAGRALSTTRAAEPEPHAGALPDDPWPQVDEGRRPAQRS